MFGWFRKSYKSPPPRSRIRQASTAELIRHLAGKWGKRHGKAAGLDTVAVNVLSDILSGVAIYTAAVHLWGLGW